MTELSFKTLSSAIFPAIFGVFGIYHLLSYLVLKHRLLGYYFILIVGLTLHWSLKYMANGSLGFGSAFLADKISLITAMLITFGLLIFTREYLNISKASYPKLAWLYTTAIGTTLTLPVLHLLNELLTQLAWLNTFLVMTAAITAMIAVLLNLFAGIWLFRAQSLNRYYLYANAPILLAAILYIGTWFLKRQSEFDASSIVLISAALISLQMILFSILVGIKFKTIEDENLALQIATNKRLQSEVDKQTRSLQIANEKLEAQNEELEEVNQLKNKLFSLLTHDVRGPLNNVKAILGLIQEELAEGEVKQITEKLGTELSDRISMVNGLLHWSYTQLEGVKLNKTHCNLYEVFSSIQNEFERIASDKKIEIVIDCSHPELYIDEETLKVILRNLTSNAIKFSDSGQQVVLWSRKQANKVEIGVRDFGMGMDSQWFNKLSDAPKPQTKLGTQGEKGTGFGLIIARDFVEMNGGEMICESEPDKGTNFVLRFDDRSREN